MREVEVADGVALSVYHREGAGDERAPFLLVHGLASNLHLWDGVAEALVASGHTVAAPDLRGHGSSAKPDGGYDLATLADDLVGVLGALELDRAVVAGQSMGAHVALELAWRFPERVRGVACIDGGWIELRRRFADWQTCAAALRPPIVAGRRLADMETMLRTRHPDWPEAGIRGVLACFDHRPDGTVAPWLTLERHLSLLRSMWDHRPSARYGEIQVPVLLVPARRESVDEESRRQVEEAAAALPRSRVQWMEGDHDLHAQHPEAVAALLSSFSVESAAPPTADATKDGAG